MYIFIDESGNFTIPNQNHKVSCVAALIIPESFAATLFRRFRQLTRKWRNGKKEVKGSYLDEKQIASVLKLLKKFDVLLITICLDMGMHTEVGVTSHKNSQADKFKKVIRDKMNPLLKEQILTLERKTRSLSNQLFIQSTLLNELLDRVLRLSTLYYVQRISKTLGDFKWVVDAKDRQITPYEQLWRQIVCPAMQYKSLKEPMTQLTGADYSAFSKFQLEMQNPPEYLKNHVENIGEPFLSINLNEVLSKKLIFADSTRYSGLQIIDILASTLTRACNGKLQPEGWTDIGRLMVQETDQRQVVRFLTFQDIEIKEPLPYENVIKSCDKERKQMLTKINSH